jgi:hypothetical protein
MVLHRVIRRYQRKGGPAAPRCVWRLQKNNLIRVANLVGRSASSVRAADGAACVSESHREKREQKLRVMPNLWLPWWVGPTAGDGKMSKLARLQRRGITQK